MARLPGNRRKDDARQGIALIVVLGFLSVVIVLAVAFVIAMRTERLATRNSVDLLRARYLTEVATARAIDYVNEHMTNADLFFPDFDAIGQTAGGVNFTNLLDGTAVDYIPTSLRPGAHAASAGLKWTNIVDGDKLLGRFAFLAVDCSGLLDVSSAGGRPRLHGTNFSEVVISNIPEIVLGNVDNLLADRQYDWIRFESLPELWELCRPGAAGYLLRYPDNIFVYSRFPDFPLDRIRLDGTNVNNATDIINAFAECGIPNAAAVYDNLRDYTDTDREPRNLDSFTTEAVPMINEIIVSNYVIKTAGAMPGETVYDHYVLVEIETWYPFPTPAPTVVFETPDVRFPFCSPASLNPDPSGGTAVPVVAPGPFTHQPYTFHTTNFVYHARDTNTFGRNLGLQADVHRVELKDQGGAPKYDRMTGPIRFQTIVRNIDSLPLGQRSSAPSYGFACVDPRVNWNGTDPLQWIGGATRTPMATNIDVIPLPPNSEGVSPMYVADRTLQSVGELGFLSVGIPWRTIALYNAPGMNLNPVLDYFRIGAVPTNSPKGLINLNSQNTNVLAAGFIGCPIEFYPDDPMGPSRRVTDADAYEIAGDLWNLNDPPLTNISSIGLATNNMAFYNLETDVEKESVIRNSYELFNPRQNLFTLFVMVQSVDDVNDNNSVDAGEVRAEQKAVAVVWRDPVKDATGRNPTFVRFFRWLLE